VAVLGVLAIVAGVAVGLVVTAKDDGSTTTTASRDGADANDSGGPGSDTGGSADDDAGEGSEEDTESSSFTEPVAFDVVDGDADGEYNPDDTILLEPSFTDTSGIEELVVLVDGDDYGRFAPGTPIELTLAEGRYRVRLEVVPTSGPVSRSAFERIRVVAPYLGNPQVSPALVRVAQRYSDALANGQWSVVRSMNPAFAGYSDSRFEEGWGDIDQQFLVPVETEAPNVIRVGLIVHQLYDINGAGGPQTSIFCNTWTIDPVAERVTTDLGPDRDFPTYGPRHPPEALEQEVLSGCHTP